VTRVLLIDNYDSFTYNLAHQLYRVAGVQPLVVRNDALSLAQVIELDPDAIIISPGPGRPDVAADLGVGAAVLEALLHTDRIGVPLLGVCLGFQALVHAGGGVVERTEPVHGRTSEIRHTGTDLFAGLPQRFAAVRYHSLAARPPLPDEFEVLAWASDGVPMGVRHRHRPAWGVQFHPESICTSDGDRLLETFLALAAACRPATPPTSAWSRAVSAPTATPVRTRRGRARCWTRRLARWREPEDVFVAMFGDATHAFWLDSSLVDGPARFSMMGSEGSDGTAVSYDVAEGRVTVRRGEAIEQRSGNVLDVLAEELDRIALIPGGERALGELPLVGGYVGYLGYEVGADCDGRPEGPVRKRLAQQGPLPDAYWMLANRVLTFDHRRRDVWAVALDTDGDQRADCERWLAEMDVRVAQVTAAAPVAGAGAATSDPAGTVTLRLDREPADYLADITACQEAIRAGESYELCLTTQAELAPIERPLELYRVLRQVSPAPYAAYLRLGDRAVLSSSPERFLAVDGDRMVTSRPMKGTAPRDPDPTVDAACREALAGGAKDRAENLMIVDLLRNDLGRVSEPDSVRVPALMTVESYATVHQMTSTVVGRLPPGVGAVDCIRAAFPGGSMTGAPKLRSMEILDRLEPRPRGVYSGSLGYLSADGRADLNIVIRTAVCTPEATTLGIGGAITALSDPRGEFDEIVLKAQGLVRALLAQQGRTYHPDLIDVRGPRADQRV
jgi:para-aminobenzoate synthetase